MRYTRLLAALMAVLLALSLAACVKDSAGAPSGMSLASPDFADYRLFVPETWTVTQSGGAVSAYVSEDDPANVSVMSWEMTYYDSTVDEWWQGYIGEFETVFTDFTLESTESTVLDGVSAQKYIYTGTLGENTYRYTQYAAVRAGVVYLITCTELAAAEDGHSEDFANIAAAFTWN